MLQDTALLGQMLWLLAAAAARNQLLRDVLRTAGGSGCLPSLGVVYGTW